MVKKFNEIERFLEDTLRPEYYDGIQKAIEAFIAEKKRKLYRDLMEEASKDETFLKRTLESQSAFEKNDSEINESW